MKTTVGCHKSVLKLTKLLVDFKYRLNDPTRNDSELRQKKNKKEKNKKKKARHKAQITVTREGVSKTKFC